MKPCEPARPCSSSPQMLDEREREEAARVSSNTGEKRGGGGYSAFIPSNIMVGWSAPWLSWTLQHVFCSVLLMRNKYSVSRAPYLLYIILK